MQAKRIELGDKMDLASYLLKPVQRMGKYALLLQQLMKAVTQGPALQEVTEDIDELQKAEEMVRFQLRHGNDLLAMDSLRDCDVCRGYYNIFLYIYFYRCFACHEYSLPFIASSSVSNGLK